MKKIKVHTNEFKAHKLIICNSKMKLLLNTDEFGYTYFNPPSLGVYIIIVDFKRCFKILIDNYSDEVFCISFNMNPSITIKLTDEYYKNLPVEKGKIFLWQ